MPGGHSLCLCPPARGKERERERERREGFVDLPVQMRPLRLSLVMLHINDIRIYA